MTHSQLHYCQDYFAFSRHKTRQIMAGSVGIGGDNPIRIQAIISTSVSDSEACAQEIIKFTQLGCDILRIPIHSIEQAAQLETLVNLLEKAACFTPLAADLYCDQEAAFEAVKWVEIIRIDPAAIQGDPSRIHANFQTFVYRCKELNRTILISTQLSTQPDAITAKYGNTPIGMCESAIEFATIARDADFHNFAFAMNASNPKIYIEAYRLLVARLIQKGPDWNYPIHLTSMNATDSQQQTILNSIVMGPLLADGIGDTIRSTITVDDPHTVQLAEAIISSIQTSHLTKDPKGAQRGPLSYDPYNYSRRQSHEIEVRGIKLGASHPIRVVTSPKNMAELAPIYDQLGDRVPEFSLDDCDIISVDPYDTQAVMEINALSSPCLVTVVDGAHDAADIHAFRLLANKLAAHHPILLKDTLRPATDNSASSITSIYSKIKAAINIGALLMDGIGSAILIQGVYDAQKSIELAYDILYASGVRTFQSEYIVCPSCSSSQFNLPEVTEKIQSQTGHLKDIKIAIMGCIVNGPNELSDSDYGYIGNAQGKVTLYRKKQAVKFNLTEDEALQELVKLIKDDGRWISAPTQ